MATTPDRKFSHQPQESERVKESERLKESERVKESERLKDSVHSGVKDSVRSGDVMGFDLGDSSRSYMHYVQKL
jgi:hypothetical protein